MTQDGLVKQVLNTDTDAVHLVSVGGANATAGGAQLARTQETLGGLVKHPVVGGDHVGVSADQQLGGVLAARGNFLDFAKEHL